MTTFRVSESWSCSGRKGKDVNDKELAKTRAGLTFILSPFAKRLALYSSSFWDFSLFQPRAAWDPVLFTGKLRCFNSHN